MIWCWNSVLFWGQSFTWEEVSSCSHYNFAFSLMYFLFFLPPLPPFLRGLGLVKHMSKKVNYQTLFWDHMSISVQSQVVLSWSKIIIKIWASGALYTFFWTSSWRRSSEKLSFHFTKIHFFFSNIFLIFLILHWEPMTVKNV